MGKPKVITKEQLEKYRISLKEWENKVIKYIDNIDHTLSTMKAGEGTTPPGGPPNPPGIPH